MLDPELGQRAADLGQPMPVDLLARLGGEEVMAAAIGVEGREQTHPGDHLGKPAQARERPFLLDEEGRIDLAGRVIHRHDEIERRPALQPGMGRAVLKQHHPRQRPACTLLAMRRALRRRPNQTPLLKNGLGPGVAQIEPAPAQLLMKMLHREVVVSRRKLLDHPLDLVRRRPAMRNPAAAAVDDPLRALRLVAVAKATKMPLAHPQKLSRLQAAQLPSPITPNRLNDPSHPYLRQHSDPSGLNRTNRLLRKPDISCATDTVPVLFLTFVLPSARQICDAHPDAGAPLKL